MIQTGQGRPLGAIALAGLLLLLLAPTASAGRYGNVVNVKVPRPSTTQVSLAELDVLMGQRGVQVASLGNLNVRFAGGQIPRGYAVAAVQARPKGNRVKVRLVAVRTGSAGPGPEMRLKVRIGDESVVYKDASTNKWKIGARTTIRGERDCGTIVGEASRWRPVGGLGALGLNGARYGAKVAVGATMEHACDKNIHSVSATAAQRFLTAVDRSFSSGGSGGGVEGFYATWARDEAGNAKVCVYVRGDRGGTGQVTVSDVTQRYELDDRFGVGRIEFPVAGEGRYSFVVRWRQPDGSFRESQSSLRVPATGQRGGEPEPPYSAAGSCA